MTSHTDALGRSLADRLAELLAQSGVPGGAAAIRWDGGTLNAVSGLSSMRTRLAVDEQTAFRAASVTKVFVAAAVMKLVEAGSVALEDPVRRHLPNFSVQDDAAAEQVTVADLLTHRGGWQGDFIDYTGENDDALELHVQNMRTLPQLAPPGEHFSYSNTGFCVLGRIIERVAGEPFESAVRHLALEPFGITDVKFSAAETITGWFAVGHTQAEDSASVADMWELPRCARPAGGAIVTASALSRFAAQFTEPTRHLSSETTALMTTPRADAVGTENLADEVGLGWLLQDIDGTRVISHAGDVFGQHAVLLAVPDARFAMGVTTNGDGGELVCESLARWALKECLDLEVAAADRAGSTGAETAAMVAGAYESSLSNVDVTVAADGSARVTLEPRPLMPDWPAFGPTRRSSAKILAGDVILMTEDALAGARARVIRDADGRVAFLRVEGRLAARTCTTTRPESHVNSAPVGR